MTKQTKILTGLLTGAAVGATIALVVSSNKNSDLKEKLSDWFCDILNSSKDKFGIVENLLKSKLAKNKA